MAVLKTFLKKRKMRDALQPEQIRYGRPLLADGGGKVHARMDSDMPQQSLRPACKKFF